MILNSPTISGSLTVTGNIVTSGSITLSGSVASASYALSASNAATASSADNFLTRGTLTAQTLVVQTITSSVDFVTGSTRFGSLLANTHQFTGSVSITGSLAVVTTGTEFQVGATGVTLGNVVGDTHNVTGSLRISGSLSVNAGTTTVGVLSGTNATFSSPVTASNNLTVAGLIYGRTTNGFPTTGAGYYAIKTNNFDAERGGITLQVSTATNTLSDVLTINYLGAATFASSVTAGGGKPQLYVSGDSANGAGIHLTTALSGTNRRNWGIYTEELVDGDFVIKCSTAAGGNPNIGNARFVISRSGNVGIGTASPGQLFEVVGGEIKAGRVDSSQEGGQVSFARASDNATGYYIDVYGSTSTPDLRFVDVSNSAVRMTINSGGDVQLNSVGSLYSTTSVISIPNSATTIFTSTGYGGVWLVTYNVAGNPAQVGYAIVGNAFGSTLTVLASAAGSQTALSVSGLNLQLSQSAGGSINTRINVIKLNNTIG